MSKGPKSYNKVATVKFNNEIDIALAYYMEHEEVSKSEAIRNLLLIGFTTYYDYTTTLKPAVD